MSELVPPPESLIATAAALRATGESWENVGAAVDRHADTVRRWPDRYPAEWARTYRRVEMQQVADAAHEARIILRAMLRDKRGKYRLGAATQLLHFRSHAWRAEREPGPEVDETVVREAEAFRELRSMSDEDLERSIERARMNYGEQEFIDGAGI